MTKENKGSNLFLKYTRCFKTTFVRQYRNLRTQKISLSKIAGYRAPGPERKRKRDTGTFSKEKRMRRKRKAETNWELLLPLGSR